MNTENSSYSLIDSMDSGLRGNILKLDQKLKGLRAEINAKLESPFLIEEEHREEYIQKLTSVSEEINTAIQNIETLVTTVTSQDQDLINQFLQSPEMQEFKDRIPQDLAEITELKSKF